MYGPSVANTVFPLADVSSTYHAAVSMAAPSEEPRAMREGLEELYTVPETWMDSLDRPATPNQARDGHAPDSPPQRPPWWSSRSGSLLSMLGERPADEIPATRWMS